MILLFIQQGSRNFFPMLPLLQFHLPISRSGRFLSSPIIILYPMQLRVIVPPKTHAFKQVDNRWGEVKMTGTFCPRYAFAFCAQGDIGYLHGGCNSDQGTLSDMYTAKFDDPDDRRWYELEQKGKCIPGKLKYHTLTEYLSYLICIGGQCNQTEDNHLIYKYNLKTRYWSVVEVQPEDGLSLEYCTKLLTRDSHCSFAYQSFIYVFGGYLPSQGEYTNSMVRLDLSALQQSKKITMKVMNMNEGPSPRGNFASCIFNNQGFIFGGTNSENLLDDFWKFSFETETWTHIAKPNNPSQNWPLKRKGATLVVHEQSQNLLLFGGMQQVTKQLNDLCIYLPVKQIWVKIHSTTNNIYDPSPTLKQQVETSPTMINHKNRRQVQTSKQEFQLQIMDINPSNDSNLGFKRYETEKPRSKTIYSNHRVDFTHKANRTEKSFTTSAKAEDALNNTGFVRGGQRKMSVVQEKKYRQFLARKKKLLHEICSGYKQDRTRRPLSPTSECINYTLNKIGQQQGQSDSRQVDLHIPKVIYDDKKSLVIGKKPCARDGHAAFGVGQNMYIIGGDRHTVSFNDTHLLRMDKAIESLEYYYT